MSMYFGSIPAQFSLTPSLMIWVLGQGALRKFINNTKLREMVIHQRIFLPYRGTWMGWRYGLTGTHECKQGEITGEEQTYAPICVGGQQTGNILAEKDLRILVDTWLKKYAAKKANEILRFMRRSIWADWEDILSLCALLVRSLLTFI